MCVGDSCFCRLVDGVQDVARRIACRVRHRLESRAMATTADKLVSEFRALPAEEKLRLLDMIFTEMDTPDPEIDEIWANEARKRWKAYKAGKVNTVSYDEVISRA